MSFGTFSSREVISCTPYTFSTHKMFYSFWLLCDMHFLWFKIEKYCLQNVIYTATSQRTLLNFWNLYMLCLEKPFNCKQIENAKSMLNNVRKVLINAAWAASAFKNLWTTYIHVGCTSKLMLCCEVFSEFYTFFGGNRMGKLCFVCFFYYLLFDQFRFSNSGLVF